MRRVLRLYRDAFVGLPREVWLLAVTTFVNCSGMMVVPFLALFLTSQRGMGMEQAGWMLTLFGVGTIAGGLLGGRLSDGWGTIRIQTATLLAAAALT